MAVNGSGASFTIVIQISDPSVAETVRDGVTFVINSLCNISVDLRLDGCSGRIWWGGFSSEEGC